tara:strand:+ start:1802 stop:2410 length:609 start_codon:yes stop_codon:yes gene_type:complete
MSENNENKHEKDVKSTKTQDQTSDVKKDEKPKKEDLSVEDKLKDAEDKLLRSLAELENQRRRFEKEIKDAFEFGSFNFARESLAILDNLQRAKIAIKNDDTLKTNKDLNKFIENISIIEKDLLSIFERNKIKKVNCVGEKFDPNLHQAMNEVEDNKVEPGTIVQEIQAGYMLVDRLLRPALVSVSKQKNDKKDKNNEKKGNK